MYDFKVLNSVIIIISIKKPFTTLGSKRRLQSPSIKSKSALQEKTGAIPIKKAKIFDESEDEETETSTTTVESDYSLHDNSSEDDTPTEDEKVEELSETTRHWKEYYRMTTDRDQTQRGHFLSQFYLFLMHGVGGSIREEQILLHVRQVHKILEAMDKDGQDLSCLICNDSMDIWTEFFKPNLDSGTLKGNTLKKYLKSLELFWQFIERGVFYKNTYLTDLEIKSLSKLSTVVKDYSKSIRRLTSSQTTTRKVEESLTAIKPADMRTFATTEYVRTAVRLIGEAWDEIRCLTKTEFVQVRDYLMVTALFENASRPGPLENCLVDRFQRPTCVKDKDWYIVVVDEQKPPNTRGLPSWCLMRSSTVT